MEEKSKQLILGIDGGATKTDWALCEVLDSGTQIVAEGRLGPGSMKLLDPAALRNLLGALPREAARVGVYLAGCATEQDRTALRELAESIWPEAIVQAGGDRESGFAAAFGNADGISVIAGTGSAVTGRKDGREARAGGWGHLLGDSGGGYDLAIHALRRVLYDFDTGQHITPLAADTLHALGLNTLRELSAWAQSAQKSDLARLTPIVFAHADDAGVRGILADGAETLACLTVSVAKRLGFTAPPIRLMGGVFVRQPWYVEIFTGAIRRDFPQADVAITAIPASLGAVFLAGNLAAIPAAALQTPPQGEALASLPTEQVNPRAEGLDRKSAGELVGLFTKEEHHVEAALRDAAPDLTRAVEITAHALAGGGRLFYVGAGTSGRLGMLDASEMPPTFGVDPAMVQAILAGGAAAFQKSAEGAEDSREGGSQAVGDRGVRSGDVVCGITASGRTPFVLGALARAREIGAQTLFLTCNPNRDRSRETATVEIDLATGPELIAGSTRLKAGTATKVALNILSSCVMVLLGRVDGSFMACLRPTNEKLRDRATRIVATRAQISPIEARQRLECANWDIRAALLPGSPPGK